MGFKQFLNYLTKRSTWEWFSESEPTIQPSYKPYVATEKKEHKKILKRAAENGKQQQAYSSKLLQPLNNTTTYATTLRKRGYQRLASGARTITYHALSILTLPLRKLPTNTGSAHLGKKLYTPSTPVYNLDEIHQQNYNDTELVEIIDNKDHNQLGYHKTSNTTTDFSVYTSMTLLKRTYKNGLELYVARKNATGILATEQETILGVTVTSRSPPHTQRHFGPILDKKTAYHLTEKILNERAIWKRTLDTLITSIEHQIV